MKTWRVVVADAAENDLREIFEYIAFVLLSPEIAQRQLSRIMDGIQRLGTFPERHPVFDNEMVHGLGIRRLNADNYAVFYTVSKSEKTVTILRVIFGGRDIDTVIDQDM